mgnify:CR=1 FL=1
MTVHTETDDLHLLIATLPVPLQDALEPLRAEELLEVVLDLGRRPQARLTDRAVDLSEQAVGRTDLDRVVAAVGEFGGDNRAGIEGTLHRISCIRNRRGEIVGLTLRVGRAVFGTIEPIRELVESGVSLLLLGPPGVGKTTRLREVARVLADELGKRVVVVDTSNEIAGDGDIPHPAIGGARRMQVPQPERQHAVMIEAVENHMPEAIVIDEIGTAAEVLAARTIAERGVQLVGTAHGTTLENLLQNPTLSDLVGGVQTVTLGDEEARHRGSQKTVSERKGPPTFDAVVELVDRDHLLLHPDSARTVDDLLRARDGGRRRSGPERRARPREQRIAELAPPETAEPGGGGTTRIYAHAISRDQVEKVLRDLRLNARTVTRPEQADMVVTLRARADDARLQRAVTAADLPVHVVKKNTTAQIRRLLEGVFNVLKGREDAEVDQAVHEAEEAVRRVREEGVPVALAPRPPALRRVQHRLISRHRMTSESEGSEPHRHLVILPA